MKKEYIVVHHSFSLLQSRSIRKAIVLPFIAATLFVSPHTTVAQAAGTVDLVSIIDGQIDVDQANGITAADDLAQVVLAFDDAAIVKVQIMNGYVDANENQGTAADDDLLNVDLNRELAGNLRVNDQVDIIDGRIDVNEDGAISGADDLADVRLWR